MKMPEMKIDVPELIKELREQSSVENPSLINYYVMRSLAKVAAQELEKHLWIPVTERLPEPETDVLALFDNGDTESMWQNWANGNPKDCFVYDDLYEVPPRTVTHWMPLPEGPEVDA